MKVFKSVPLSIIAATMASSFFSLNAMAIDTWRIAYIDTFDDKSFNDKTCPADPSTVPQCANLKYGDFYSSYHDTSPLDYGLNYEVRHRQLQGTAWTDAKWERRDGTWYVKSTPVINTPWLSQVSNPYYGGTAEKLNFFQEHSAVVLNKLITAGVSNNYHISYKTDPVVGDLSLPSWTSLMLDSSNANRGWPTQTQFGFLIGSNGSLSLFQNGNQKSLSRSFIPAANEYTVDLDIKSGQFTATVNGASVTATLDEAIPASAYLYLGSFIDNTNQVSTFDDLIVKTATSSAQPVRIVTVGDSETDGVLQYQTGNVVTVGSFNPLLTNDKDYSYAYPLKLKTSLQNKGINADIFKFAWGGATTRELLAYQNQTIAINQVKPDYVVLMLGVNDGACDTCRVTASAFTQNYRALLQNYVNTGAKVITLSAVHPYIDMSNVNNIVQSVSLEPAFAAKTRFVNMRNYTLPSTSGADHFPADFNYGTWCDAVTGAPQCTTNNIHPSPTGYGRIADIVANVIQGF